MTNPLEGGDSPVPGETRREFMTNDLALINIPSVHFQWTNHVRPISFLKPGDEQPDLTEYRGTLSMTGFGRVKSPLALFPPIKTLSNVAVARRSK